MKRTSLDAPSDTTRKPPKRLVREKADLDNIVEFSARDSVVLVGTDRAYMYGDSKVTYGDIKLDAANIDMNMATSQVYAVGVPDSTGEMIGEPVFTDAGTDYESKTMHYNFKTGKGYITDVITQQGDGYLTGGQTKKIDERTFYLQNGRYTTCDHHDDPHFYLQLTKAKVTPKKNIVSGPAYMVLAGLPLPLAVPFGYFPFSEKYSSGIIMPTFGDDYNKGFYLSNGGYYFAFSDYMDLRLTGDVYTKGSWQINAQSRYVKRYKYNGSFALSYLVTKTGDKGMPDYAKSTNFQVLWTHTQDAKANPNLTFSAGVNFSTTGYARNDVNSQYTTAFTDNTKSSTVSLTYRVPNSKWTIAATANISQRQSDSTLTVGFPNLTVSMQQAYPFKRKNAVGAERWYEKIKLSYTGMFQNSLTSKQDQFFKKSLLKDWNNGMKHTVPIQATFNMFKYINVTPSVNLTDRMYKTKLWQHWDPGTNTVVTDTTYGFYNILDFTASVSLDTKVYGFFRPASWAGGKKISMIRHVMTPTISFSGAPDFSDPFWGAYGEYYRTGNANTPDTRVRYNHFSGSLFGAPSQGKSGVVSFNLANNVEMKLRSDNDSVPEKKISLIENLSIGTSYNMAADSCNWSDISANLLLRLVKNFNLNLNSTWDPYFYKVGMRGSAANPTPYYYKSRQTRISAGKGLARLKSVGTSFSYTFTNDTFRRKNSSGSSGSGSRDNSGANAFDGTMQGAEEDEEDDESTGSGSGRNKHSDDDGMEFNPDGYMKWSCPWSLTLNYSFNLHEDAFNYTKMERDYAITQNLSLSGNIRPTANWNFSMSASYDFNTRRINYMNCSVSRDLHCFTMTASFVPLGPYKSYNFHIAVTSSLLADLKYDKRSSTSNGVRWY